MNTEMPQLTITVLESGCIRLENQDCGETYAVDIHRVHLRYMAEEMGLVREMSATDADNLRMASKLKRRLLVLQKRIDHLASFLCIHSDSRHADLSYEQDYATATAEICEEFCADLDEVSRDVTPSHDSVTQMSRTERDHSNAPSVTAALPATAQLEFAA